MRKTLLLLSLGFLGASMALAQDAAPADQSATSSANSTNTSSGPASLQGCLSGSDGNYLLTQDGTGTTFKLMGAETELNKHLGHEVSITGQTAADTASPSASTQGQGDTSASASATDSGTVQVASVKMISKRCSGGASQSR